MERKNSPTKTGMGLSPSVPSSTAFLDQTRPRMHSETKEPLDPPEEHPLTFLANADVHPSKLSLWDEIAQLSAALHRSTE